MLNETQGDWSVAGEKWLLAVDADKNIEFQSTKSQRQKEKRDYSPKWRKEVSEFRRLNSCSLFMYFNPLLEDWKLNKKPRAY